MSSTQSEQSCPPIAEVDLAVTGMTCAACVARVEKKLNKLEGVQAVVNLATERAHIELFDPAIADSQLVETVEKAGYGAAVVRRVEAGKATESDVDPREAEAAATEAGAARRADLRRRFAVALALSIPVVLLSMVPTLEFAGWQWLVAALATVVAFWAGWPFHRAAFRAARHGSTTMDTLVALGVIASMGWSYWELAFGSAGAIGYTMAMSGAHSTSMAHLYFESAAMIVTFLLLGRMLEARSRHSAGNALRSLLELGAAEATMLRRAGEGSEVRREERVAVEALRVGDVFRVLPGEKVATDGVVLAGTSAIDASLLTGESLPVEVGPGSEVTGATLNTHGALEVRATAVGEGTTLAAMGRLLTEAQTGKAPVQRLADKVSAVFVPAVMAIAALTFLVRLAVLGNPLETALTSAIAVLVVACPCALGLATPTALLVGSGRASELGILIKGAEVLERAHGIDEIVLDKTGTLTAGAMTLSEVFTVPGLSGEARRAEADTGADAPAGALGARDGDALSSPDGGAPGQHAASSETAAALALAAGLELGSEHPIARAIVEGAREHGAAPARVAEVQAHAGAGVSGILSGFGGFGGQPSADGTPGETDAASVDGAPGANCQPNTEYLLGENGAPEQECAPAGFAKPGIPLLMGSLEWIRAEGAVVPEEIEAECARLAGTGATVSVLAAGGQAIAAFAVRDELRPDAAEAVGELARAGVEPILVTGDNETTARAIAAAAGISQVRAGVTPGGKVRVVEELRAAGRRVAMAGDGINDAPALAGADLSIAMGSGTDAAKAASDITIMNSSVRSIARAFEISAATLRIIRQNLAWAFGYNLVAIPLAVLGIIVPGVAAAAMASSSVIVVTNSLRLRNC